MLIVNEDDGNHWHLIQTPQETKPMDTAGTWIWRQDSYRFEEEGYTWETVVKAFERKNLTEDDALMNARLAKILQVEDYDLPSTTVFWQPSPPPVLS